MLNEERKREFIQDYTQSIGTAKYCMSVFKQFQKYEYKYNKDLAEFSAIEAQPIVDSCFGYKSKSVNMSLLIIKEYIRWCSKKKYPTSNGVFEVEINSAKRVKSLMIGNEEDLKNKLNKVFFLPKDRSTDTIYRCYLWMAYMGIRSEDAVDVEINQVNIKDRTITIGDRVFDMYQESIPDFKNAVELDAFVSYHTNPDYSQIKDRVSGDKLLRGVKSDSTTKSLGEAISRRFAKADIDFKCNYIRIYRSGIFDRIYHAQLNGENDLLFEKIVEYDMEGKSYSNQKPIERVKYVCIRELKVDYECWKQVFHTEYV